MSRVQIPSAGVFRIFSYMVFNFLFLPFEHQKSLYLRADLRHFHLFSQCNMVEARRIELLSENLSPRISTSVACYSGLLRFPLKSANKQAEIIGRLQYIKRATAFTQWRSPLIDALS